MILYHGVPKEQGRVLLEQGILLAKDQGLLLTPYLGMAYRQAIVNHTFPEAAYLFRVELTRQQLSDATGIIDLEEAYRVNFDIPLQDSQYLVLPDVSPLYEDKEEQDLCLELLHLFSGGNRAPAEEMKEVEGKILAHWHWLDIPPVKKKEQGL